MANATRLRSAEASRGTLAPIGLLALLLLFSTRAAEAAETRPTEIKIATVAPRGSMWMRLFNKMKGDLLKRTNGAVKLRFYPGQVQGDERDVVRKIRTGQLHGGAFTAIGLAQINTEVLVLQMPLMFQTTTQLDRVREALRGEFEQTFAKKGFVLLGWGEVGPVHYFSEHPIGSLGQLRKQKMWAWSDDPIAKAMMRALGISPRILGLPQVLPSLNTGIINAVYNSPLGLLALQWHTKVGHITDKPNAIGIGATVITRKIFDKLSAEHQKITLSVTEKYHRALIKRVRRDNDRAHKALLSNFGFKVMRSSAADEKAFTAAAKKVRRAFVPRYYSQELLNRVLALRDK